MAKQNNKRLIKSKQYSHPTNLHHSLKRMNHHLIIMKEIVVVDMDVIGTINSKGCIHNSSKGIEMNFIDHNDHKVH